MTAVSRARPSTYLALGDSYTIGEGVAPERSWPAQLTDRLRQHGLAVDLAPPRATTGWTTDELLTALDEEPVTGPFDLVSLLIGVNDQYRGKGVAAFRTGFTALVERAVAYAGGRRGRVFAVSIPDWSVTPHGADFDREAVRSALEAYNEAAARIARHHGIAWFDIVRLSRAAAHDPSLLAEDDLHPSARMYTTWADALAAPVAGLLSRAS